MKELPYVIAEIPWILVYYAYIFLWCGIFVFIGKHIKNADAKLVEALQQESDNAKRAVILLDFIRKNPLSPSISASRLLALPYLIESENDGETCKFVRKIRAVDLSSTHEWAEHAVYAFHLLCAAGYQEESRLLKKKLERGYAPCAEEKYAVFFDVESDLSAIDEEALSEKLQICIRYRRGMTAKKQGDEALAAACWAQIPQDSTMYRILAKREAVL